MGKMHIKFKQKTRHKRPLGRF